MTRMGIAMLLAALLVAPLRPAAAQEAPRGFPLGTTFKGISISGFDVQKSGLTLTVKREGAGQRVVGSGNAGCNNWSATFIFRDETQFDVADLIATKKHCGGARMKTEEAFLTTLRSAHRWRVDGNRLILEGDAGRLLLTSGATAADKKTEKKPARKRPATRESSAR